MPMSADQIQQLVKQSLPNAQVTLVDLAGDNDHWELTVADESFRGKSRIEQHKLVYAALGAHMGTTLHALKLSTKLP